MNSLDLISMAMRNLFKRKVRTFLTIFAVSIGTIAIVVMMSIGIAFDENFEKQMAGMGTMQVIRVSNPALEGGMQYDDEGNATQAKKNLVLDNKTFESFRNIEGVEVVTPVLEEYLTIGKGKMVVSCMVFGVDPEVMPTLGLDIQEGRMLEKGDEDVFVMGKQVPTMFMYANQNGMPSGEPTLVLDEKMILTIDWGYGTRSADKRIKGVKATCVGVLNGDGETAYSAYVPIDTLQAIIKQRTDIENEGKPKQKEQKGYRHAWVKCKSIHEVSAAQKKIQEMGFNAWSQADMLKEMKKVSNTVQMVFGAIGAVSLLIAAIGITNTMVMSIYERTREIGVMKVIGASLPDIRNLFLTEAAFIGFIGGLTGLMISLLLSFIINVAASGIATNMYGMEGAKLSSIPFWLSIGALVFTTITGIVSGFFPARRAMNLSALSAIRTQ